MISLHGRIKIGSGLEWAYVERESSGEYVAYWEKAHIVGFGKTPEQSLYDLGNAIMRFQDAPDSHRRRLLYKASARLNGTTPEDIEKEEYRRKNGERYMRPYGKLHQEIVLEDGESALDVMDEKRYPGGVTYTTRNGKQICRLVEEEPEEVPSLAELLSGDDEDDE